MNPLQEKLIEIRDDIDAISLTVLKKMTPYEWREYIRMNLESLVNLTLEEAKKAVPEAWNKTVAPDCNCNMCYAHDKCRQQTLEALDEMKL